MCEKKFLKKRPIKECCDNCNYVIRGEDDEKGLNFCNLVIDEDTDDFKLVCGSDVCRKFTVATRLTEKRDPSKKVTLEEIKEYHWSCPLCAKEAGGEIFSTDGVTMERGYCEVCKTDDATLIAWVDFKWNNI